MRWSLILILALFVGLTCAFNAATPYRTPGVLFYQRDKDGGHAKANDIGTPDERQHANYVAHLLAGKGFPVLVPGSPDLYETYQSHQPPLYYILEAGWCKVVGKDPTAPDAGFPVRLLNAIIGALTLWGVYCLAKWAEFDETVALGATAFVGLIPMFIGLHAAVSNDPLLYFLCTWGLAFVVKGLKGGSGTDVMIAGACFGLAVVTKTTGLALAVVLAVAAILDWRKGSLKNAGLWVGAIVLGFLIASPWLLRNMAVYHELFATKVFLAAFTGNPLADMYIAELGPQTYWLNFVMWWTVRSFVGVFGYMDIFLFEKMRPDQSASLYTFILVLFGLLGLGSVLAPRLGTPAKLASPKAGKELWLPALTLLSVVIVLFIGFNLKYFQGQARYVYPAIAVVGLFVAQGCADWFKDKRQYAWIGLLVLMLLLDFVAYGQVTESFPARIAVLGAS